MSGNCQNPLMIPMKRDDVQNPRGANSLWRNPPSKFFLENRPLIYRKPRKDRDPKGEEDKGETKSPIPFSDCTGDLFCLAGREKSSFDLV